MEAVYTFTAPIGFIKSLFCFIPIISIYGERFSIQKNTHEVSTRALRNPLSEPRTSLHYDLGRNVLT